MNLTLHIDIYLLMGKGDAYGIFLDELSKLYKSMIPKNCVCVYVCICVYRYTHTDTYIHMQKILHIHIHVYMYRYIYAEIQHIDMSVYIYICMSLYTQMYTHDIWKNIIQNINSSYLWVDISG